jgi:hypothetical protein
VVLSKRGRNVGPKHTKILVTNLDEWIPRQVVSAYQRRWPVEHINRELKTDLGLGEHQVSREEGRIEKSQIPPDFVVDLWVSDVENRSRLDCRLLHSVETTFGCLMSAKITSATSMT